ncbi:MAG: hypothetical protein K2J76_09645 [Oscillospiraceae bacterium]|nr:hypothetical protein [Oscillospiraceae bacterium]
MNKNLSDISNALEDEVLIARALSDIMDIFHTAACGFRKTDLDFENIQNASWLIFKISKYHSEQLLEISNDVFNAFKENDNHSSSNAPV